jgi:protein-disulfide isomerase
MSTLKPPVGPHDHVQGPPDAPITLVEYGDYECPHCGRAYPIIKSLQEALGDGLRFVFRNFPLSQAHPHAVPAAHAAEAAGLQGRFWEMHDLLFENQESLEGPHLIQYALRCGLDLDRFARDVDSEAVAAKVKADFLSGARSGVNGTPTFFVNGHRYDGSWDLRSFLAALNALREGVPDPLL